MSNNINDIDFGSEDEEDFNPAQHVGSDEEDAAPKQKKSSKKASPDPKSQKNDDNEGELGEDDEGEGEDINGDDDDDEEDDEDDEDIAVRVFCLRAGNAPHRTNSREIGSSTKKSSPRSSQSIHRY